MFNRNDQGAMVYEPPFLRIAPGDAVRFVPTKPSHNAATIEGRIPQGAEPLRDQVLAAFRHGHGDADRGRRGPGAGADWRADWRAARRPAAAGQGALLADPRRAPMTADHDLVEDIRDDWSRRAATFELAFGHRIAPEAAA
jgi:hypothetical protein